MNKIEVIGKFVEQFISQSAPEKTLYVNSSELAVFSEARIRVDTIIISSTAASETKIKERKSLLGQPIQILDELKTDFDLVIGDLPIGGRRVEWKDPGTQITSRIRENWLVILKSLQKLKGTGYGLYLVEPAIWSNDWHHFLNDLEQLGYFINGYFNPPENFLYPKTSLQPLLALFSRHKSSKLFVAELDEITDVAEIATNLFTSKGSERLTTGICIEQSEFQSFYNYKIEKQIKALKSQYDEYEGYRLADIAISIRLASPGANFEASENAIYVPRIGTSPVVFGLQNLQIKPQIITKLYWIARLSMVDML